MTGSSIASQVFTTIYDTDHWSAGSGIGSQADLNGPYRRLVQALVNLRDVNSVVDAGCGDWQFSRDIDWATVTYRGVDVVDSVVEANQKRFQRPHLDFELLDFSTRPLPHADLLLCKDVLQHWPLDAIRQFLRNNLPKFRHVLITNDIASVHCQESDLNREIGWGAWRTIDLERAPFGLRPSASADLDYKGEWTKRASLFTSPRGRLRAPFAKAAARRAIQRATGEPDH